MKLHSLTVSVPVAILVGFGQPLFVLFCSIIVGLLNPLPHWLISLGLRGNTFRALLLPADFLIGVALSLPAALILLRLRPAKVWLYLTLAMFSSLVWLSPGVMRSGESFEQLAFDWLWKLTMLPAAVCVLLLLRKRSAPNNSFKPKPLRGSA